MITTKILLIDAILHNKDVKESKCKYMMNTFLRKHDKNFMSTTILISTTGHMPILYFLHPLQVLQQFLVFSYRSDPYSHS